MFFQDWRRKRRGLEAPSGACQAEGRPGSAKPALRNSARQVRGRDQEADQAALVRLLAAESAFDRMQAALDRGRDGVLDDPAGRPRAAAHSRDRSPRKPAALRALVPPGAGLPGRWRCLKALKMRSVEVPPVIVGDLGVADGSDERLERGLEPGAALGRGEILALGLGAPQGFRQRLAPCRAAPASARRPGCARKESGSSPAGRKTKRSDCPATRCGSASRLARWAARRPGLVAVKGEDRLGRHPPQQSAAGLRSARCPAARPPWRSRPPRARSHPYSLRRR